MKITPEIFFYAGLGLIVVELFIGVDAGFDLVLLGGSLLAGGVAFWISSNLWIGIITATIIAFAYLLFGRKTLKRKLLYTNQKINTDRLIDTSGIVVKRITPHKAGQVKIAGEVWRAVSDQTIGKNQEIVVKSIEGVTLKVQKKEET
jgi:membrane protein implicated in regulation of membrane protease activity